MPEWGDEIRRRLAPLRLSPADEANVAEELEQHLDDRYHELRTAGASDAEAYRGALEEVDADELVNAYARGARRRDLSAVPLGAGEGRGLAGIRGDLRFGARMLRRTPGFTATAMLTIALGIGVNTTIFSILNAVLLRPVPGTTQAHELVQIGRTERGTGFDTFAYPDYLDFRDATRSLASIAAVWIAPAHLSTGGASERVRAEVVSGSYFTTLGTRAALGRLLAEEDDGAPGANPVVVLSHGIWERRFASDPSVVGRHVTINGDAYTVVGVAERGFNGAQVTGVVDVFVPMAMVGQLLPQAASMREARGAVWLELLGRMAPGTTPAMVQAELADVAAELARRYPETNENRGVRVVQGIGLDPGTRESVTTFMTVLLGVVGLVLLIACANVANLLLARGTTRARELAVRASLGASRFRLVRQLLAEGFLLATLGGLLGFGLGVWSLRLVLELPVFANSFAGTTVSVDSRVLAFATTAVVVSGILFALPPAFQATRVDLVTALKLGAPGSGDGRSRLRSGLVVAQIALSLVLLVVAGLLVRTLQALYRIEPGYDTRQVLVATIDAGLQGYDDERGRQMFEELERRVAVLPGVERAALGYMLPLGGGGWDSRVFPAEVVPAAGDEGLKTDINVVSPSYFATLGIELLRGRGFTSADRAGSPPVAVINEAMAERVWPGEDAIGRRFRLGREGDVVLEVVGLVQTARYRTLTEPARPFFYRPFAQVYRPSMALHVRSAGGDPYALLPAIRRTFDGLDRDLPLSRVRTLAERVDGSVGAERTAATLVTLYGALALVLAAVGLYGSMAYSVSRRTREIGLRMALGAPRGDVLRHVLGQALRVAMVGVLIGLVVAVPATRYLRSQLYGVGPNDPLTLLAVLLVLAGTALAAAFLPARRATRVDPVVALRSD
ncbi:MAG TPA: ABC transporter permease [Gemmatimonadaceae bacterium]|nr:ABC transporter permease [Gemmatimonadaceae bacterium]